MIVPARAYVAGSASGTVLRLSEALSFWGGVAAETGEIIDRSHPECGKSVAGRILVMPGARGSSSSSSVFAETVRRGVGPLAVILGRPDPILTVGSLVAQSLYDRTCPILVAPIDALTDGDRVEITPDPDDASRLLIRISRD